jgi:hypothetical protein
MILIDAVSMAESIPPNNSRNMEQSAAPVLQYQPNKLVFGQPATSAQLVLGKVSIGLALIAWLLATGTVFTQDCPSALRDWFREFGANIGALAWLFSAILGLRLLRCRQKHGLIALWLDAFWFVFAVSCIRTIQ